MGADWNDDDDGGWQEVFDRARTIGRYEQHDAEVWRACPTDRLIKWRVADG